MKALLLALAVASVPPAQTEPDELLTIPHILRTPLVSGFAVAPDGKRAALDLSVVGRETIWIVPGDGAAGAPLDTRRGVGTRDADWSPDGKALAFVSNRGGSWNLSVSDEKGQDARQLASHPGEDRDPRWSPDGKSIAYLSRRESGKTGWDLWVSPASGGGEPRQLTERPFDEADPRWSPDGKKIAVTLGGGRHQARRIGVVAIEGGELFEILPPEWKGDSFSPRWSPDGRTLAFVSDERGKKSIFGVPAAGGAPEPIVASDYELTEPVFSPDGKSLAYLENRAGDVKLWIQELGNGTPRCLTLRNGVHAQPLWRPDGKAVLALFEAWNYSRDVWSYLLDGGRERVSDTLPVDLDVRKMVRPELVEFKSFDARVITGYLYLPEQASASTPARLLVQPHGGPTSQWLNGWHPFTQFLVQKGYAVFAPNVRGSTGFGVAFENLNDRDWGRGDLEDLVTGARQVLARPEVADERVGIWGVSYGGFLTLAAITRYPDFFSCAIEAVGMPDLESLYRETNDDGRTYLEREIGTLRGNLQLYRDLSPLKEAARARTPLLSFHGEIYPLVPHSTKTAFFDALRKRPDYPLQEYVFRGEEARATYRHDLHPEAAWAYVEKILEFLELYL
jgi:dipeptidyl aminopeptidase/acylaminoacyl peptidase